MKHLQSKPQKEFQCMSKRWQYRNATLITALSQHLSLCHGSF